ncbi:MAG TPA: hypothetical protein VJT09_14810 [Pyrinomonadaceae bacterium]|nr:hypothetical protein [Pyrinomonadaceae bacterium]
MEERARALLVEAGILPQTMPVNFTFNKVEEILRRLENTDRDKLLEAVEAAGKLKIRGPLATVIFIKHHLEGEHEVEIDRVDEGEESARLAVLVYPEGEVPVPVESLPTHIAEGVRLRYAPPECSYR